MYRIINIQGITIGGEEIPEGPLPENLLILVEDQLGRYRARINALLTDWRYFLSLGWYSKASASMDEIREILGKTECLMDWEVHARYSSTDRHGNSYSAVRLVGWEFVPHKLVRGDLKKDIWIWI